MTGATGFFGAWLLSSAIHANRRLGLGVKIVALTRSPAARASRLPQLAEASELTFHPGDVSSFDYPSGSFDWIVHGAACTDAQLLQSDPRGVLDSIVSGTHRTLDFSRTCGARKLLIVSSAAIYGPQPLELTRMTEDFGGAPSLLDRRSAYAEGKRICEYLGLLAHQDFGVAVTIARCFAFVGPYLPLDSRYAIGNFVRDGLAGRPITVKSDGASVRSYLYAGDMAAWLWTILAAGKPCRPYNVGSDSPVSIAELASKVANHFGLPVQIAGSQSAPEPSRLVPCVRRAREELGLSQLVSLEQAIERTVGWHRQGWPRPAI